ncbi:GNAT family N-acetyltransferase [Providencia stuartii]|uniref:GNAT family N-acetyltransferase n=1 Tax=Providencia stuartii TaxID=588 RepID=UPI0011249E1B|nr:GNAT family N-acetyltransferase [Providencia stuartii]
MNNAVNPHNALLSFQKNLITISNELKKCTTCSNTYLFIDGSSSQIRFNYMLLENNIVKSLVSMTNSGWYKGLPCLQISYSTAENYRGQGIATNFVGKVINEIKHGFKNSMPQFYIEAVIDRSNLASISVAKKTLAVPYSEFIDTSTQKPMVRFILLIK